VLPGEAESLEERLPLVAEEFNRTVAFYNSGHIEKPLDATVPVYFCGDLAEKPETWKSAVSQAGYPLSALPSPVELPEGLNSNEFMVNIGLALKELLVEKEGANFSLVNFNALPEAYVAALLIHAGPCPRWRRHRHRPGRPWCDSHPERPCQYGKARVPGYN
jgi:hypothetical protein